MGSYSDDDENKYQFFDAQEHVSSDSDLVLGSSDRDDPPSESENSESGSFQYDVWLKSPSSVKERRAKFLKQMGVRLDRVPGDGSVDNLFSGEIGRVMENSGAVLRNSIFEDQFSSGLSSVSSLSTNAFQSVRELESDASPVLRSCIGDGNWSCEGSELVEGRCSRKRQEESESVNQFQTAAGLSCIPHASNDFIQKEDGDRNSGRMVDRIRRFLFRRVNSISCITGQDDRASNSRNSISTRVGIRRIQRVKVKHKRKQLKELSALFEGQDIMAHDGAILTMKFSHDGQYLASAGEDTILKVWRVVENERADEIDIPDADPSCLYFAVNHVSQLVPLVADKEKTTRPKILRRTADSACVIFPQKIFRILEEPLHVFRGHKAEILDLSWSRDNRLLSSSVDKTVCLWQVGCDQCLKIFPHSNYVTSIQFNPVNDNYFISGSIDGRVRIWEISGCRVVDWTDFRDRVTAVCYRPDGLGGIIGFLTGSCRLFSLQVSSENQLKLDEEICLASKKKSSCKRITGFQFFPRHPSKVMVTSADSHIRIISGINVVENFKVPRRAGNQINVSFTLDGEHIISASEDSNVYLWNYLSMDDSSVCRQKALRSYECFSGSASIALPWFGLHTGDSCGEEKPHGLDKVPVNKSSFSSESFPMGPGFLIESIPRGSATWPEEKLPPSSSPSLVSSMRWDGRIRSFLNYGLPFAL